MRPAAAGIVVVALLGAGAGGCGDDADGEAGDAPVSFAECADAFVNAFEGFDATGIDLSDGFDEAEADLATERIEAIAEDKPVVAPDAACTTLIGAGRPEELEDLFERLDPIVVQLLTTPAAPVSVVELEPLPPGG